MSKFTSQDRIGDIVVTFPKAAEVFKSYRIDYCCGGDRPLDEALKEQALNEEKVLSELNASYEKVSAQNLSEKDWNQVSPVDLVEHILDTHHAFLWANLPKLSELTTTILRVHGVNHPELKQVYKLFHTLKMELEVHLMKEETVQYPAIFEYFQNPNEDSLAQARSVIQELDDEHVAAGGILKALRDVTSDFSLPEDACNTYRKTYVLLEKMESDVFQHIHLENNILFPKLLANQ